MQLANGTSQQLCAGKEAELVIMRKKIPHIDIIDFLKERGFGFNKNTKNDYLFKFKTKNLVVLYNPKHQLMDISPREKDFNQVIQSHYQHERDVFSEAKKLWEKLSWELFLYQEINPNKFLHCRYYNPGGKQFGIIEFTKSKRSEWTEVENWETHSLPLRQIPELKRAYW